MMAPWLDVRDMGFSAGLSLVRVCGLVGGFARLVFGIWGLGLGFGTWVWAAHCGSPSSVWVQDRDMSD